MTLLLFQLYEIENHLEADDEDDEPLRYTQPRFVAEFADQDAVRDRIERDAAAAALIPDYSAAFKALPLNRWVVYESTEDTDSDGFPDGFKALEALTASTPESKLPTVRKAKRR